MAKRRRLPSPRVEIERLAWTDIPLGEVDVPKGGPIRLCLGVGSGLCARRDRPGRVWAIADRGPNFKVGAAVKRYGLKQLARLREIDGAKIMPRTDIGRAIDFETSRLLGAQGCALLCVSPAISQVQCWARHQCSSLRHWPFS